MLKNLYKSISLTLVITMVFLPVRGFALPTGEQVVAGSATFDRSETNTLKVNQSTDKLIANYNSFSIAQPEAVHFLQPSSSSVALNRVAGVDPSSILGTLTANGKIFLINPNGVIFGQNCQVNAAGLVASTLNIADSDFLAGRYTFVGPGGSVVNQGYISSPGGFVSLLGSSVENKGIIEANLGSVALASGNAVTLNLDPQGLISVVVNEAALANTANKDSAVKNTGTLKADGGKVLLTAKTLEGVFNKAVNNEGVIEAKSLINSKGEVSLLATGTNNLAANTGTIDVSAKEAGAAGGNVEISADKIQVGGSISAAGNQAKDGLLYLDPNDVYILTSARALPDATDSYILESTLENYIGNYYLMSHNNIYFDVDDNHLNLQYFTAADFATSTPSRNFNINASGGVYFGDNMVETQGGSVYIYSDVAWGGQKADGVGDIVFDPLSGIITHGGNIELHGANVRMNGATIEAIGVPSEMGYEQQINLRIFAQPSTYSVVYGEPEGDITPYVQTTTNLPGRVYIKDSVLTVQTGPCNSAVDPAGNSHSQMDLRANTKIEIDNSILTSKKTTGGGTATIGMNVFHPTPSIYTYPVSTPPVFDTYGTSDIFITGGSDEGKVTPTEIKAIIEGDGDADIRMQVDRGIYIGDFDNYFGDRSQYAENVKILSDVNGKGDSNIGFMSLYSAEKTHFVADNAEIRAEADSTDSNQNVSVGISMLSFIGIADSLVSAHVGDPANAEDGSGNAMVRLNVSGEPYKKDTVIEGHVITEDLPSIAIDGATLQAEVEEDGYAYVSAWGNPNVAEAVDGGVAINGLLDDQTGEVERRSILKALVGGDGTADLSVGSQYSDVNISYSDLLAGIFTGLNSSSVSVLARRGDLNLDATNIEAFVESDGNSSVVLKAEKNDAGGKGNIKIVKNSVVSSRTEGNGGASVEIASEADTSIEKSTVKSLVNGNSNPYARVILGADKKIDIKDSSILEAIVAGNGRAAVNVGYMQHPVDKIKIENSSLAAKVGQSGDAYIDVCSVSGLDILGKSSLYSEIIGAEMTDLINNIYLGATNGYINIDGGEQQICSLHTFLGLGDSDILIYALDSGLPVTLNKSDILAEVKENGDSLIETASSGDISVKGSLLTAKTYGNGGAEIDLDLMGKEGNASVLKSQLWAQVMGAGKAGVYVYNSNAPEIIIPVIGGILDGPINGKIDLNESVLHAEAANLIGGDTARIGLTSTGSISLVKTEISAKEKSGMAVVGLLSNSNINVDAASIISATTEETLAAVGLLAGGYDDSYESVYMDGTITADGGAGFGVVGIAGSRDLLLPGTISAKGGSDAISLLEYWLDEGIDIAAQNTYGSAVVLGSLGGDIILGDVSADLVGVGSLYGSIYQVPGGLVKGKYLAMVAAGDIGTCDEEVVIEEEGPSIKSQELVEFPGPINTDVDIVSAYSWDYGDIFINEANDLEVGLFLPIGETYYNEELGEDVFEPYMAVQFGVAANDGMISIISQGDMLVNSVIAPRGGVFLQSAHGSIYAGHTLDPRVWDEYEEGDGYYGVTVQDISSLIGYGLSYLDMYPDEGQVEDFARCALMDLDYTPWGYNYNMDYFSPVMIGSIGDGNLDGVPNVIAGGYSYFSTPEGTIGVGTPDSKNSAISGEIVGEVYPTVQAVTGTWGPGIDLSRYTPPGLVYFSNFPDGDSVKIEQLDNEVPSYDGPQIWPASITEPPITSGNPLVVSIFGGENVNTLPDWFVNSLPAFVYEYDGGSYSYPDFSNVAALTLEIGPPPQTNPINNSALLANPLMRDLRAYYELMSGNRFQSIEPATPTNFFAYHPLVPTDMTAFDDIALDAGAYDFISDDITSKKKMAPYYGL